MTMTYNYTGCKYTYVLSKRMNKRSNTKVFTPDSVTKHHLTIIIIAYGNWQVGLYL